MKAIMYDLNATRPLPPIITIDPEVLPVKWKQFCITNRIKLHVVLMYLNEVWNGKIWPASAIIDCGVTRGNHQGADTIIDSTSGNYAIAVAEIIRRLQRRDSGFPIKRVIAVVSRSLEQGKRDLLLKQNIELVDANDSLHAMQVAEETAKQEGYWYTRQYWNADNSYGFRRAARSVANQLPWLGMMACGVGSGGTCSGFMEVLLKDFANRDLKLHRTAVVLEDGASLGGVRGEAALEPGTLSWRAPSTNDVRFVGEDESYVFSAALWRQKETLSGSVCIGGASTGFVAEGAMLAVRSLEILRTLDSIRAPDGFVHVAIPSMDTRTPYRAEYEKRGIYLPDSEWELPTYHPGQASLL